MLSARPAAGLRSITRPRTNGPRSLMRTTTERPSGDYSNAAYSWDLVLKPHRRATDQSRTNIDVIYGPADGRTTTAQQVARSIQLLETVAEHAADEFTWPSPFTLEMQSCGYPNAHWDLPTHKLTLCCELAPEFADLCRT
jgi:hypothetical protein